MTLELIFGTINLIYTDKKIPLCWIFSFISQKMSYEELLKPEVEELGLPDFLTNKASEKAIDIISKKLKEKYIQKTS